MDYSLNHLVAMVTNNKTDLSDFQSTKTITETSWNVTQMNHTF